VSGQRETKRIRSAAVELKGDSHGRVRAIVAHLNRVDLTGDVVLPGATPAADVVMTPYDHSAGLGNLPPGKGRISEQREHLVFDAEFFDTESGREHRKTLLGLGPLAEWSVEYKPIKVAPMTNEWRAQGARRLIERWTVFAVAPVLVGAMQDTETLEIKRSDTRMPTPAQSKALLTQCQATLACAARVPTVAALQRQVEDVDRRWAAIQCETAVVSDFKRDTIRRWANAAAGLLGLPPVTIHWRVTSLKTAGAFRATEPHAIYLNPTLPLQETILACLHEQAHRCRHLRGMPQSEALVERDTHDLFDLLRAA
jgi:hypothetical protein